MAGVAAAIHHDLGVHQVLLRSQIRTKALQHTATDETTVDPAKIGGQKHRMEKLIPELSIVCFRPCASQCPLIRPFAITTW
jgi:hypothetical protein